MKTCKSQEVMRNNNHSTNQQFLGSYLSLQILTWLCIILMHDSLPNLLYHEPIELVKFWDGFKMKNWVAKCTTPQARNIGEF